MVGIHVEDDGHSGEEGQERVAVFTGLQNNGVPVAHPVAGPQGGQHPADHNGWVPLGGQEDVGAHRGGGGLAVGPGHAQGILIVAHEGTPGLGPLEHGDTGGPGGGDLRVVIVDGGGADDAVGPGHALGQVADGHGDAQGAQVGHLCALVHVRAGDHHPGTVEHLGQGGHGHPAHAHQMGPLSGTDIVLYLQIHNKAPRLRFSKNKKTYGSISACR